MKQIISRLKNISMMLIWGVITAIALFVFAYFSLDRMPSTMYKVLVLCGVALFVIIMLVIKYQLLYKKYGRDDVTGGKNKKIRADCQRFASRGWKLCCRVREHRPF